MGGNEWVVKVTADLKGILDASRQIGQAGKQAGEEYRQGFGDLDKILERMKNQLKEQNEGLKGNAKTIGGLKDNLSQLSQTLDKAAIGSKEFVAAQKEIAATQKEIDNALKGVGNNQSIQALRGRLNELNQTLEKTAIGSREFKQAQREIASTQRQVDQALGRTSAAVGALSNALTALGFVGVTYSVVGFLKGSVDKAVEMEVISRKLSVTLGAQGTAGALAFARETADQLGISYRNLTSAFGGFTAAATAAGVPLQVQKDLFAAVAKAGQVLGLSNDEVKGSFMALQQMASKGVVSMEELRQQLGERLPISLAAAAKGFGVSQQQLIKLVESGKLASAEFFPALTKGLNELTQGSGGVATAAQNFSKLQNAWDDLQASFGTSLLPTVTAGVKGLAAVLEGIKADAAGKELQNAFGLAEADAAQLAGQLKAIQNQYALTGVEAKNLLSNVIATSGASKNWFGQLNVDAEAYSRIQEGISVAAKKWRETHRDIIGDVNNLAAVEKQRLDAAKALNAEKAKELAQQAQLAEAVGRTLQAESAGRVSIQQATINLGQALVGLEESRFGIIRNRNDYELQQAQKRGASEQEINAIKKQGDEIDRAALTYKYNALVQRQELQKYLLALQQEQARLEADQASSTARLEIKKAELKVDEAKLSNDANAIKQAEVGLQIAQLGLNAADSKLQILTKTQSIESQIAGFTNETAQNQIKAEAAAKGLALAADGTFKATQGTNEQFNSYQDSLYTPLDQVKTFQQLVRETGLEVEKTSEGYYKIKTYISDAADSTQAARSQTAGLASNMDDAADAARSFYNSLNAAAGLPPARFTGGPVAAGQTYRVNDGPSGMSLGQEAFLSASGALSLINRPMNSLWTAPSKGTVIPAAITSHLKDRGLLGGAGMLRAASDPAMAHLAMAVGNLSQEVAELRRKAWNVSVGVRGDGSSLKLAQTMARMR